MPCKYGSKKWHIRLIFRQSNTKSWIAKFFTGFSPEDCVPIGFVSSPVYTRDGKGYRFPAHSTPKVAKCVRTEWMEDILGDKMTSAERGNSERGKLALSEVAGPLKRKHWKRPSSQRLVISGAPKLLRVRVSGKYLWLLPQPAIISING